MKSFYLLFKKLFILVLLPILISAWILPACSTCAAIVNEPFLLNPIDGKTIQNMGFPDLPDISRDARLKGIQPASLKNLSLRLKEGVNWLSEADSQIIKEKAVSGKISQSLLPSVVPGRIYIDPFSMLAFEFVRADTGSLYMVLADEDKIVEEISIPEQIVFLNEANITTLAKGINTTSYKMKSGTTERSGFNFYFDERQTIPGYDKEGKRIEVALKGSLNLDSPAVEVKYTKDNGYKFVFFASQTAEVKAEMLAEIKKDVKIPLYDFTIPAKGCKITVGFFLVLGVDGRITMDYSVKQSSGIRAGLQGDTSYYLPSSLNTVKEVSFTFTPMGLSLSADVKGETSLLAEVAFDVLGKCKVIFDNKLGVLLEAKAGLQGGGDYLSIKGDGFVKINGRIKVKSFDKSKTIYEYKYPLFNYVKERSGGYSIDITEACAYKDIIKGKIAEKATAKPYANKEIQLKINDSSGNEKVLSTVTDNSGAFIKPYDLKKGSMVRIKVPGSSNIWSYPREASFPFDHVAIEAADYLTDTVNGYLSGSGQDDSTYNGPVSIYIERSNNISLHPQDNISLPVEYAIKLNAQSTGGKFKLQGADIRPFDKVYAVLEKDGFVFSSNKLEAEGINVCVEGGYKQEANRLSSPGSYVLLGSSKTEAPFTGEAYFQVAALYPHCSQPENTLKMKEWRLDFASLPGTGISSAGTGPWELDLNSLASQITSPLDRYRSSLAGTRSVNYHVFETLKFFVEGKKLEYFNEAKSCEQEKIESLLNKIEKNYPVVGAAPAEFYLKNLRAFALEAGKANSEQNKGALSPQNCTCDVSIKYYNSAASTTPEYTRSYRFSALDSKQKLEQGVRDPILFWDKKSKTKVISYQEFPKNESLRYDLDDYIPEFKGLPFALKGNEQLNGITCQVWEKSKKIDPIMNVYVKLQLFTDKNSGLPLKAIFYDGYYQKIEMLFNNWKQASGGESVLFPPLFGGIRYPTVNLELPPFSDEVNGQYEGGNGERTNTVITLVIGDSYMTVNGNRQEIDPGRGTKPLIFEGRTIMPIRAVVEALGGTVSWNDREKRITIVRKDTIIEMVVGSKEMLVNGVSISNDVPPRIIGERTFVPVRFAAENLNCVVGWDEATRTVSITTR
ncbi:MAG: stalk domain-containing protein [Clostridia bacterium]|nr:stalk domain-containing protein [Clostridia bacterium]